MRRRAARGLVGGACAVVLCVGLFAGLLAACQKVSPTVTASVSPCFRVLPEAQAALGGQGKFVDVARIRGGAVTRFPRLATTTTRPGAGAGAAAPAPAAAPAAGASTTPATVAPGTAVAPGGPGGPGEPGSDTTLAPGRRDVCLVAYSGVFNPALVQHLVRQMGNRYAIVVVGVTSRRVRGVLLTNTLPKPLHAH